MPKYDIEVKVMPRITLLDPQGQTVENALRALNFDSVSGVRVGKSITFQLERPDRDTAARDAREMCDRLLANPVTEDYTVLVHEDGQ